VTAGNNECEMNLFFCHVG